MAQIDVLINRKNKTIAEVHNRLSPILEIIGNGKIKSFSVSIIQNKVSLGFQDDVFNEFEIQLENEVNKFVNSFTHD